MQFLSLITKKGIMINIEDFNWFKMFTVEEAMCDQEKDSSTHRENKDN